MFKSFLTLVIVMNIEILPYLFAKIKVIDNGKFIQWFISFEIVFLN